MNKKTNTIIFILAGTVFNVIVTILCLVIFLVIYGGFFSDLLPDRSAPLVISIIFVASIIASFFIYRLAIKFLMKKVDMDKYFDPLFGPRRPKAP